MVLTAGPRLALAEDPVTPADSSSSDAKEEAPWLVSAVHEPADTVSFSTTEGTWINVDVSPDGRLLVFDLLGDLYLLPREGGAATRITSGPAYDNQPRFSPDGTRILYTSDRGGMDNLWTVALDGGDLRPITSDKKHMVNTAAWAPDGEYVVARKRFTDASAIGTVELWLYHVDGGGGVAITAKDKIADVSGPALSPDGRWIFFAARPGRFHYDANPYEGIWQIRAYDRETGNIRRLTDGYGGSARPQISPDGRTMSFIRRDRTATLLMLHDLDSGRERVLFTGLDPDLQEGFAFTGCYPGYAWSPDGKEIVISYGGGLHAVRVADGSTRDIPFTAQVEQAVTRALRFPQNLARENVPVRMVSWPNQSPSGGDLLFSALGRLYRMDLPSGAPAPVRAEGPRAYAPAFSPDGRSVAYVTWSDTEAGAVWIMDGLGGRSRKLTTVPDQYANPVISPDGSKVAFLKGSGASAHGREMQAELWLEIHWMPVRGGASSYVTTVANRGSAVRMPRITWSPDGTRLYYFEDEGSGEAERTYLRSVRLDGSDRRDHLKIRFAEEIIPSPDGRWVVFSRLHQGFLTSLPELGRDPIEVSGENDPLPVYRFSQEGADWLGWASNGEVLTWSHGPRFFRVSLDSVETAWTREKANAAARTEPKAGGAGEKGERGKKDETVSVHPDTIQVHLAVPRAVPQGTFALVGGRLVTMQGDEVIERGTLVVKNDRITAVGPVNEVEVPAGARVFDVSGKTLIPGLVDVHAHLHYENEDIIPESMNSYYANLAYGVTTVHDPSASTYAVFTQSEMVEAGITTGPRVFSTGWILYGADIFNAAPIENLDDARRNVRRLKEVGAFTVKSYAQPRRDQRQWIIEAAREESVMVVPEGAGFLELNMTMILDGHTGIEHALPVAPIYNDVVSLFAGTGTGYTPTLLVAYGGLEGEHWFYQHNEVWQNEKLLRFLPRAQVDARSRRRPILTTPDDWHHMKVAAGCKEVVEAGGSVQLGGHGQLQGLGPHWELWALTQGGMSNFEALRSATLRGAWYLGLDGWIGSLEPGKLADIVVLDGNPLEEIEQSNTVRYVVKNGEVFDGDTMDRIWPTPRPRPPFTWEALGEMVAPEPPR